MPSGIPFESPSNKEIMATDQYFGENSENQGFDQTDGNDLNEGDTFDLLALDMYDDEKMAHYIIQANPDYSDMIVFPGGVELQLPIISSDELSDTVAPWRRSDG